MRLDRFKKVRFLLASYMSSYNRTKNGVGHSSNCLQYHHIIMKTSRAIPGPSPFTREELHGTKSESLFYTSCCYNQMDNVCRRMLSFLVCHNDQG